MEKKKEKTVPGSGGEYYERGRQRYNHDKTVHPRGSLDIGTTRRARRMSGTRRARPQCRTLHAS
jgi:hypothetical protein